MARQDAHDFLKIADDFHIRPQATVFSFEQPNEALQALKQETGHEWAGIVH
jgi:D-arabinose 1-dehydrogenase-like Zn-dependent alcohol dehydrogenase